MCLLKVDNILVSGSADETIKFWNINGDNGDYNEPFPEIYTIKAGQRVRNLLYYKNKNKIISSGSKNLIKIWIWC